MPRMLHGLTRLDHFVHACVNNQALNSDQVLPQLFGRVLPENELVWENRPNSELVKIFEKLIDDTIDKGNKNGPADAGMTFLGQFVDHDITLDATSTIGSAIDPRTIRNIRTPALDLDCVYGDGPEASPHLYGEIDEKEGFLLFGRTENPLDLARNCKGTALIGDPRNDENIFVSQVQGAFICLHNFLLYCVYEETAKGKQNKIGKVVKSMAMQATQDDVWTDQVVPELSEFEMVRLFIRHHYQWLVINDFLPSFVDKASISAAFGNDLFGSNPAIIPVEFSGAVYRFGHATVQQEYKLKESSGGLVDFFEKKGGERRGPEWDIEMAMFFSPDGKQKAQPARPVGLSVAKDLFELPFIKHGFTMPDGTEITKKQAKKLPLRNILRDRFALHIASGQQAAQHFKLPELDVPPILAKENIKKTPLWFYALQEAEQSKSGKLTGAGGRIMASVFRNILKQDKTSYFHTASFTPYQEIDTVGKLMAFVERNRFDWPGYKKLFCEPSA